MCQSWHVCIHVHVLYMYIWDELEFLLMLIGLDSHGTSASIRSFNFVGLGLG